jgi:hypothetical protein
MAQDVQHRRDAQLTTPQFPASVREDLTGIVDYRVRRWVAVHR